MARQIKLTPSKTYKTRANLERGISRGIPGADDRLRYLVCATDDGRLYPVFLVNDSNAHIVCQLPFLGFCIAN